MLTENAIRELAPAAFAAEHRMTSRYVQVDTMAIANRLADAGYLPVQADQDRPRRRDPRLVTHRIVFRHESQLDARHGAEEVPHIMLVNSHNGRTKVRLHAGFYRFICANSLVIGNDMFNAEISHLGDAVSEALTFAEDMTDRLTETRRVIAHWSQVELSKAKATEFAVKAGELRFGPSAGAYSAETLLEARRAEDEGLNLWRVFSRVQENTVKGGMKGQNANGHGLTSRALTAVQPNIAFNKALWSLAEEFAQ